MSRARRSFRRGRRGISPVISTIIIVAVAIAISIAVAFWLGGITAIFTRFEKLEITNAYVAGTTTINSVKAWNITIEIKNTGTTDATITDILINNIPVAAYTDQVCKDNQNFDNDKNYVLFRLVNGASKENSTGNIDCPIKAGQTIVLTFYLLASSASTDYTFTAGQSVTITIHTAAGQDYPKTVALP